MDDGRFVNAAAPEARSHFASAAEPDARVRVFLAAIVLVAAALRLTGIEAQPLWDDEIRSLHRAENGLADLLEDLGQSTHPPLFFLLLHFWTLLAGTGAGALRLLPALCGIATVPAVYAAGRKWAGPRVGLAAALVVALSPIHVYYSQEARSYTLLALATLGSVVFYLRALERPSAGALVAYAVSTIVAVYTHYWAFFVVLFENLFLPWAPRADGAAVRRWLGAQAVVAAAFLPWLVIMRQQLGAGAGDWVPPPPADALAKTLYRFSAGYAVDAVVPSYRYAAMAPFVGIYLPLLAIGMLPAAADDQRTRRWQRAMVGWLFVPLVAALAISWIWKPLYVIGRFDMAVYAAFALLVGAGLARIPSRLAAAAIIAMAASTALYLSFLWLGGPVK